MNQFRNHAEIESAERSLIGSALIQTNRIERLASIVQPKHFTDRNLSSFWATVIDYHFAEKKLDMVTLRDPATRIWGDRGARELSLIHI